MQTIYIACISVHISCYLKYSVIPPSTDSVSRQHGNALPAFQAPTLSCDGELGASPLQMTENHAWCIKTGSGVTTESRVPILKKHRMSGCTGAALLRHCRRGSALEHHGELPPPDAFPATEPSGGAFPLPPGSSSTLQVSLANLKNSAYVFLP